MFPKEIEVILTRHLASWRCRLSLSIPRQLIFYNEPAEAILGRRFEESGELPPANGANFGHG